MKRLVFLGDSLENVREFRAGAAREVGYQLWRVQDGLEPADWKPMPTVGIGVNEVRVRVEGEFRAFYVAKFSDAVYVLHAFRKKTRKTASGDVELARKRFRMLISERRLQWPKS